MAEQVINLTRGVPPPEVFPTEEMVSCAGEALRRDPSVLLQYGSAQGYTPLREWLGQQNNVSPSQILMGNSSLELFAFLTQVVVKPGQRVFVESPSYDRSITLIRRAGGEVVGIPVLAEAQLEEAEAATAAAAPHAARQMAATPSSAGRYMNSPHRLACAPRARAVDGPRGRACPRAARMSSVSAGSATAAGMRRKMEASELYAARVIMSVRRRMMSIVPALRGDVAAMSR